MNKKPYVMRAVKIVSFLLAVLLCSGFLQTYVLRRLDHNMTRLKGYYRQGNGAVDVVLLGASEIYTSFSAGRAYEKYGFTSYPVATESITTEGMLLALKEIVRTQKPKLILIEPNAYLYKETKNEENDGHIHKLVDNIPLNGNKIEYIGRNASPDEAMEYAFPIIKYHGIWTEFPELGKKVLSAIGMDVTGCYHLKGFRTTTEIFQPDNKILNAKVRKENSTLALNPALEQKMRELLDYCKEQELNVAFVRTPHMVYRQTYDRVKRSNRAAEIVNSYGYDYINLEREWAQVGIDAATDFYNYDHLNIYGTVKVTDYLGNLLQTKYGVGRHVFDGNAAEEWDTAAAYFEKLYRYCDDKIKAGVVEKLDEDWMTIHTIENY